MSNHCSFSIIGFS